MQQHSSPHSHSRSLHHPTANYYNSYQSQQQQPSTSIFPHIQRMVFHLKQQQLSPALLKFQHELFTTVQLRLKDQEKNVKTYKKDDDPDTTNKERNYKTIIYYMEIERVSFVLKHYLKIRLEKRQIQKCSFYYFKNMTIAESLMSKAEIEFLKKYVDLRYFCKECRYKYYEKNVFKNLAKNFKGLGGMELFLGKPEEMRLVNSNQSISTVIEPDMKSYVFVKLNRNPHQFRYKIDMPIEDVPAEQSQIASSNDILFIPYGVAQQLMERSEEGDLVLI